MPFFVANLWVALLLFYPLPAAAQVPGLDLTIEMLGFPTSESIEKNTYTFSQVCEAIGANLSQNRGLLGSGPFASATCLSPDKKSTSARDATNNWVLQIRGDRKEKIFEIFWRNTQGEKILQSRYVLRTEAGPIAILAKKSTNALIAFYLTTLMPFRSTIAPADAQTGSATIKGPSGALKRIKLPSSLSFFTLKRLDEIWQVMPAGEGDIAEDTGNMAAWIAKKLMISGGETLYIQQTEGRREILHQVDQLIQSDVNNFADKFLTLGRSGYAGTRYGAPIAGEGILKKAPIIGLFGEFRSGVLAGLKVNYDFTPAQKYADALGSMTYEWSRLQMGYGFSRALSNKIVNWVDATPRIGFTSLGLNYTPTDETTAPLEFNLKKAPTVGLEIGLESRTNYFLARLWAFGSLSVAISALDRRHTTNSLRGGVDLYRELLAFRYTKIAGLLFGAVDSTYIKKNLSSEEIDANQAENIRFTGYYAGGGLTLTW